MDEQEESKRCPRCEQVWPRDQFYVKDKATGRLMSWCKPCYSEVMRERYAYQKLGQQRPRKQRPDLPAERVCTDCARLLPASAFRPHRRRCRECDNAKWKAYYAEHPEEQTEVHRRYREAHREHLKEVRLQRYASGDPRYGPQRAREQRATNPASHRAARKRYRENHPDQNAIDIQARRARLIDASGTLSRAEWEGIKRRFDYTCLLCKRREPEIRLTIDHVVPLARGGRNDASNIQPLCKRCNSLKHVTVLDLRGEV